MALKSVIFRVAFVCCLVEKSIHSLEECITAIFRVEDEAERHACCQFLAFPTL
jgi:hypothetical protein